MGNALQWVDNHIMIAQKHWKLFRKFMGNVLRPRFGMQKKFTKVVKFCYLLIEWPFELLGDLLFFWKRIGKTGIKDPRRILIVKIDQFGDVLFSTFLLPIIKKRYPHVEIDYLVNPKTEVLLEKNPHIANIYFWEDFFLLSLIGREKSRTGGLREISKKNRETLRALRARHYDAVLNTRAYPPSSNIPWRKIGGALISFDISEQSFLADYRVDYDLDGEEWKNYLNLLTPLGIDISSARFREEFYNHDVSNPMADAGKYVVLSPVSFDVEREWGRENWKELIAFLAAHGTGVALTGMPSQKEHLEDLASASRGKAKVLVNMSIPEFGALMKGAAFFAGIDSFPAHLALAEGKRAVVFVNPAAYYLLGYSPKKFARDARCMLPVVEQAIFLDVHATSACDTELVVNKILTER
jgi:ADP-heptose:LPS heptosyltransferase